MSTTDLEVEWEAVWCNCPYEGTCQGGFIDPHIARYQGSMDFDVAEYIVGLHNTDLKKRQEADDESND